MDQQQQDQVEALRRASNKRHDVFDRICERKSLTRSALAEMSGEQIADLIGEAGYPKPDVVSAKRFANEYAADDPCAAR